MEKVERGRKKLIKIRTVSNNMPSFKCFKSFREFGEEKTYLMNFFSSKDTNNLYLCNDDTYIYHICRYIGKVC